MKAYYFFSGFKKEGGFAHEIAESLRDSIQDRTSLVLIASYPTDFEMNDIHSTTYINWFQKIGIEFDRIDIIDGRKAEIECVKLIKDASAIFLCGGPTLLQMDFIKNNNLIPLLKGFNGVIMGMSAGAINMAENSFYSADKLCPHTHIYKGIGLADISIEPHFSIENISFLEKEILPFSDRIDIYAMCDNSAIAVHDNKHQYYGDIYLVSEQRIKRISASSGNN